MTQKEKAPPKKRSNTRLISDLVPALAFFIGYVFANKTHQPNPVIFATLVFLPVAFLGFIYSWVKEKKLSPLGIFIFASLVVFSGLALWFKDDFFIKIRPTIIQGLMGIILLVSVFTRHNLLQTMFDGALHMPENIWRKLTITAGSFYVFMGALNYVIWKGFSEKVWVFYTTWGDVILSFVFWIGVMLRISRHLTDENGNPLLGEEENK